MATCTVSMGTLGFQRELMLRCLPNVFLRVASIYSLMVQTGFAYVNQTGREVQTLGSRSTWTEDTSVAPDYGYIWTYVAVHHLIERLPTVVPNLLEHLHGGMPLASSTFVSGGGPPQTRAPRGLRGSFHHLIERRYQTRCRCWRRKHLDNQIRDSGIGGNATRRRC